MNDNQDTFQATHARGTNITNATGIDAGIPASATNATPHTSAAPATPAVLSAVAAGPIVDELLRLGMVDTVMCLGSRLAPLAHALVQAADATKVRPHVRIDERSAASLVLGLASRTRKMIPVITTPGTAIVDLISAMVETTALGIPLLALVADHPAHYRDTGTNQVIVQDCLFVSVSVVKFDLDGTAPVTKTTVIQIRTHTDRVAAVMASGTGRLNVRLVEPLVPDNDSITGIPENRVDGGPWTTAVPINSNSAGVTTTTACSASSATISLTNTADTTTIDVGRRTLVIAGLSAPCLPKLGDLPAIAEPNAYAPTHPVRPLAVDTFAQIPPEQIVLVGRPTLHREISKLLANPDIELTVVSDAENHGFRVKFLGVMANARTVAKCVQTVGEQDSQWAKICEAASELAVGSVRGTLTDPVEAEEPLTGFYVAVALTDSLCTGDDMVLGASNPARDALYTDLPFPGANTYAGRGAMGIDGTVATTIDIAPASNREHVDEIHPPWTTMLTKGLTFQHDFTALATGPLEPGSGDPAIMVTNDADDDIFETPEAGSPVLRGSFEHTFGMPQDVDSEGIYQAYGVEHMHVGRLPGLPAQLHSDTDTGGTCVIEIATACMVRRQLHHRLAYNAEIGILDKH